MPDIILTLQMKIFDSPLRMECGQHGYGWEIRLDLLGAADAAALDERLSGPRIVSCRRVADGGRFAGPEEERAALLQPYLKRAGAGVLIDVEWDGPLREWIRLHPGLRFVLSYHNLASTPTDLAEIWAEMRRWPADRYKIVTLGRSWRDVLAMRPLLAGAAREGQNLTAYCLGPWGHASRLLGLVWGCGMMYVSQAAPPVPGMLTRHEYESVYRAFRAGSRSRVFGVVGDPVEASLSPLLHNWFFDRIGSPDLYLPMPAPDPDDFWRAASELAPAGLSVTVPHKERWLGECRSLSPEVRRLGALNTLSAGPDGWRADNTDWIGFERSLAGWVPAGRNRFLVLGAGGTARAILYALARRGADVWCWNRDPGRLDRLRADFPELRPADDALPAVDVVVNATSASRSGLLPLPVGRFRSTGAEYALEVGYGPASPFLEAAAALGWRIRDGRAMLFHQAAAQHRLWTGAEPPVTAAEAERMLAVRIPDSPAGPTSSSAPR